MGLTPEEIRHVSIKRGVRGYDREETDQLLAEIADSYQSVWHQRANLDEELTRAQAELRKADERRWLQSAEETKLRERLEQQEAELENLRAAASGLETDARISELLGESQHLRVEIVDLRAEVAAREAERSRLLEESERSRAELAELRHAERAHARQLARAEVQLENRDAELADLRGDVQRLEVERAGQRHQAARLEAELEIHRQVAGRIQELLVEDMRLIDSETLSGPQDLFASTLDRLGDVNEAKPRNGLHDHEGELQAAGSNRQVPGDSGQMAGRLRSLMIENLRLLGGETRWRDRDLFASTLEGPEREDEARPAGGQRPWERDTLGAESNPELRNDPSPEATRPHAGDSATDSADRRATDA